VATDPFWTFFDKFNQTSADTLDYKLDSLMLLVCAFPGYPKARKESYHRFKNWNNNVKKRYKVFNMHTMAAAHEVALVTKSTGDITRIDVNPHFAHPLSFENSRFAKSSDTINRNKLDYMSIFPNNEIFAK